MPPPDAVHGNGTATQCEACHPDTAGPGQTIINPDRHVDGVVDTSATCDACHGQNGDPTPPRDLAGLLVSPKVGVHQAHRAPQQSAPVACTTCHLVPNAYSDPGHADTPAPAEVRFTGIAGAGTYAPAQLSCASTYCHGAGLAGGATSVRWNDTDGSEGQCGACHGMPPPDSAHGGVSSPNGCNVCHVESAGPNQSISQPNLHIDGTVQVSGGGCDSCHGSPPAPGNESYSGSAGAHAQHAQTLGFECAVCHGHNGSGPTHNPNGVTTVSRNLVEVLFTAPRTYPGGTTLTNGRSPSYDRNNRTCAVGCHNPIVGNPSESPNLDVGVGWNAGALACRACHDTVGNAAPLSHPISTLGDTGCTACHSQTGHTQGTARFADPDPNDTFVYSPANYDGLCKTCHDGGNGTYFGGRTAPNVSGYWTVSSHGGEGYRCSECHTYHGSTGGPRLFDRDSSGCLAAGCHDDLTATFNQVPGGPRSHHRIEGGTGIAIECADCHNPHLTQPVPLAVVDPDNKYAIMSIPASALTNRLSSGDYRAFCLRCHDGTPPAGVQGALNIATALNGGTDPTMFKDGNQGQHGDHHDRFNCQNCHLSHGSPGTGGINRGRLLRSYMSVDNFPYTGEGSCNTPTAGNNFSCH
jgi:predicted CxxxxCH...CXXCH cytochrome family protein